MTTKHDQGKWRFSLLPAAQLLQIIQVLEFGANKYTVTKFKDTMEIGEIIERELCLELARAKNANYLPKLLPKVCVQHATGIQRQLNQNVADARKCEKSAQKPENVVLVTKPGDLIPTLLSWQQKESIAGSTGGVLNSEKKKKKEKESGEKILSTDVNRSIPLSKETYEDMASLLNNMSFFVGGGAQYAEAMSDHTLTTTIKQGSSEISFAVSATKLLDCYKTLLILLQNYWHISISISDIQESKSGVDNWKAVPEAKTRYFDACIRHLTAWWQGEKNDSESGLSHLAHAACCILFLMWIDDEGVKDETN